jgi:hypothetical protein
MMIDSTQVHEALNLIAIDCHKENITNPIVCISQLRKVLNDIEAETACRNAQFKYAEAIECLKNK